MAYPQNLFEVWTLYQLYIDAKNGSTQAKRILNEAQSAIMRILLRGLGYEQKQASTKMTRAEVSAAKAFMEGLGTDKLIGGRAAIETGFRLLNLSQASRNTYGNRLDQFLTWCEEQPWWRQSVAIGPTKTTDKKNDHAPRMKRGHGITANNRLTGRRSVYITYQVQPEEITLRLKTELNAFYRFLTDPDRNDRWTERVSDSTAHIYLKHIRLMLGWFHQKGTPRTDLSLDLLVPKLTKDALKSLTFEQREMCWRSHQLYIDNWICQYFEFLREEVDSKSPQTKRFKTHALTALAKFQYCTEVISDSGYQEIPVLRTLSKHSNKVREEVSIWNRRKDRVVPMDKKWPKVVEGQTALTTIRKQVVEELRLFCRPKYLGNSQLRSSNSITSSLRDYIAWSTMTDMPARRQEESRSWRISLVCPIERPEEIPYNGFYHPLPPDSVRERDDDNLIADNYLYKTYVWKGKVYPEGIWVLDINNYKTQKRYGSQSIVIKNRQFADGNCFYDYIEHYLYGWWRPEEEADFSIYSWWDSSFIGQRGQWICLGRAEFKPQSFSCVTEQNTCNFWSWGYFFVMPRTGNSYTDSGFKEFFSKAVHKVIGQRITPHVLRDMWATWSYQVGLTDAQRESLAYAMGMDVKTLEDTYERCSPDEKRRPIEEVVDQVLFGELEADYQDSTFYLGKLAEEFLKLPATDRLYYKQLLSAQYFR